MPGDATPASEPPPPEPLRAVDEATRVWLAASAVNVDAEWRGLEASGDATRPSRLTLEVSGVGSMRFDLARAVSDFPVLVTGTGVRVSGAPTASLRITRTDGALVLGVASACDLRGGISDPTRLPAFLAPLTGGPGAPVCREPVPTYVANDWCYVGRSEHSVLLDSVSTAVAPGATVRASVGGARYDFINHRFAIQDEGGPLRGNFCLPAISALCSVSAYAVAD